MFDFIVNDAGYYDPYIYDLSITLGKSSFEHEDWFLQLCLGSLLELIKITV
jgi:hypothetical protein